MRIRISFQELKVKQSEMMVLAFDIGKLNQLSQCIMYVDN